MRPALRSCLAGVMALAAGAAAAGWSATLPDGRRVSIVSSPTEALDTQLLERRHPDGSIDRQFGKDGRVSFSLGADSPGARSIRLDASGRLLVVGAAVGAADRAVPASLRFLGDGRLDLGWGVQGRSLIASPGSEAVGVDLLPLPDGSVLVLGQIEGNSSEQAALWRLGSTGLADPGFGQQGTLRATGLDPSEGLGLQLDDDGAALVAVMTVQQGMAWLEVHRWQPGQATPLRVARQPMPTDWQGPVTLARRGGAWQWFDASQPATSGGVPLLAVAATAVWSNVAIAPAGIHPSVPSPSPSSEGGAAWNPFATGGRPDSPAAAADADAAEPPWAALALVVLAALGALARWQWRRYQLSAAMGGTRHAAAAMAGLPASSSSLTRATLPRAEAPVRQRRRLMPAQGAPARHTGDAVGLGSERTRTPALAHTTVASGFGPIANTQGADLPVPARDRRPPLLRRAGNRWRANNGGGASVHAANAGLQQSLCCPSHRVTVCIVEDDGQVRRLLHITPPIRLARQRTAGWRALLNHLHRATDERATVHLFCDARALSRQAAVTAWLQAHKRIRLHALGRGARRPSVAACLHLIGAGSGPRRVPRLAGSPAPAADTLPADTAPRPLPGDESEAPATARESGAVSG